MSYIKVPVVNDDNNNSQAKLQKELQKITFYCMKKHKSDASSESV